MKILKKWFLENKLTLLASVVIGTAALFVYSVLAAGAGDDADFPLQNQVIRLHVIAESDLDEGLAVKYAVRDRVWAFVDELFEVYGARNLSRARVLIAQNLPAIEEAAQTAATIHGGGAVTARLLQAQPFPAMAYGSFMLPRGRYEALQVTIGGGGGSNWWCVVFPPLCLMEITRAGHVTQDLGTQEVTVRPRFFLARLFRR